MTKNRAGTCPICRGERVGSADNEFFPMCSRRCSLLDLAAWLGGDYRVPVRADETERSLSGPDSWAQRPVELPPSTEIN